MLVIVSVPLLVRLIPVTITAPLNEIAVAPEIAWVLVVNVAAPPLNAVPALVIPFLNSRFVDVVTAVDVQVHPAFIVTAPIKISIPVLLASVKDPVKLDVPVTVKLNVLVANVPAETVRFPLTTVAAPSVFVPAPDVLK